MNAVEALVAKSLVLRVEGGHRARFGLLETVTAYAEDGRGVQHYEITHRTTRTKLRTALQTLPGVHAVNVT